MKVSVYAITRNERKFTDRWYASMKEADEVCVLDTGSDDGTAERLRELGCRVEVRTYPEWRFDVPRNDSMALCSPDADVLVCTDLDEVFAPGWRAKLEAAYDPKATVYRYDYVWSHLEDGSPGRRFRYEKIHVPGLYEWRYPVHELLFRKDGKPNAYADTDILLEHFPDPTKSRGSYLALLELSVKEDPSNARNVHYLCREHCFRGNWDDCLRWGETHLSMPDGWSAERAITMRCMAESLLAKGDAFAAELWFRRGVDEDPAQRECAWSWAKHAAEAKDWGSALHALRHLFAVRSPAENYVTELDAWGWEPYDLLGMAFWYSGQPERAREAYAYAAGRFPGVPRIESNRAACGGTPIIP